MLVQKYNHTSTKEINLLPSGRFFAFMNFKIFLFKKKKMDKFDLNYHKYDSTIRFAHFEVFFLKIPTVKNFSPPSGGELTSTLWGEYCPHMYKNYT